MKYKNPDFMITIKDDEDYIVGPIDLLFPLYDLKKMNKPELDLFGNLIYLKKDLIKRENHE